METERIVNISELEDLNEALYLDAVRLREEVKKESPSMICIDELSKRLHLNALKAKDFEFYLERRIVNVSNNQESPKEIMEHILSEMKLNQQVPGKNPFEFHATINRKPLFDNFSEFDTEKRISEIERKLELIKECVNSGKKINLFWDGVM